MELFWENGWTEGHPVVPPVEEWVQEFLDYVTLEPDQVIGTIPERDRVITAEKLAINAVMAGCRPEYMPVLVAAMEAICDPDYKFNHLASLGSPCPLLIVNGPIAKELGINSGMYCFGPGSRPNATIGRAISLLLWNCAEARPDGIQRGQLGNPMRYGACVAENEDTGWEPLHVQLGFGRDQSAVTVVSVVPPSPVHINCSSLDAEVVAGVLAQGIAEATDFRKGTFPVFIPPAFAESFIQHGWSKDDVKRYIVEHCRRSVAELKRRGRWGVGAIAFEGFQGDPKMYVVEPGDEDRFVYLFKDQEEYNRLTFRPSELAHKNDIYIVVAGGDAGSHMGVFDHYSVSTDPVTKSIKLPGYRFVPT
ncbi:MAG: hypothetical protein ACE5IG_07080 [Dehalococcoidia bacterium]